MRRWVVIIGMMMLFFGFDQHKVSAGPSATVQCDSYKMDLKGTTATAGVSYTEHVVLEKVKKSGNAQGKWKLTDFEQIIVYPQSLNMTLNQVDHHELGHGLWMDVRSTVAGKRIHTRVVKSNIILDVVGNRIGYVGTNVWCGRINGNQASFKWHMESPTEPTLTGPVTLRGERIKVEITSPEHNERWCFSEETPGRLTFTAKARTSPANYVSQLIWEVEKIPGSQMVVEPANRTGPTIRVTYTGLPPTNSSFGAKKLSVSLNVGDCQAVADSRVRLFFPAFATNNPSTSEPNWFYYWKQTRAAIGPLQYGGSAPWCTTGANRELGVYRHTIFDSKYYICNLRNLGDDFPFTAKKDNNGLLGDVNVKGIDTFAVACQHENAHYTHTQTWWKQHRTTNKFQDTNRNGILDTKEQQLDKDGDLVPDDYEISVGLDPNNKNTKGIGPDGDDEELLCWMAETRWQVGSADSQDWAKPGKQWQ